jgi:hypothetical protein
MMTHLIIHLVDELKICGLVGGATQWKDIYQSLKNVKNKARPKTYMASSYMYDEALGFCT